jgi:hypothetical protein
MADGDERTHDPRDPADSSPYTSQRESVGYGRPPKRSQFKKGQSGNSKGRPRGSKSLATLIEDEMRQAVTVTENGTRKKISKKQAIAKRVVNGAIAGDPKMVPILLGKTATKDNPEASVDAVEAPFSAQDELVIRDVIARLRSAEPLSEPETSTDADTAGSTGTQESDP